MSKIEELQGKIDELQKELDELKEKEKAKQAIDAVGEDRIKKYYLEVE